MVAQVPVERGGDAVLGKYTEGEVQALMREVQAVTRYVRRSLTADCGTSRGCKRFCK